MTQDATKDFIVNANLLLIFSVTLMAVLGVASITPAFPLMSQQLGIPRELISFVIIVFTLPGVLLTPFLGVAADRFGRKRILVPSLLLFGIAGFLCSFSQALGLVFGVSPFFVLLFFRTLQGVGAASLGSLNITLIGDLYKPHQLTRAMSYNASVQSVATAAYPTIGGFLALFGWFFPFYLPLLAIPIGLLVLFVLKTPVSPERTQIGQYFRQVGIVLHNRKVAGLFAVSTSVFILLYGAIITFLPFFLDIRFLVDSFTAGLVISLISVASAIVAPIVAAVTPKIPMKFLLLIAFPFYIFGLALIPFSQSLVLLLIPVIFFGVAMGLTVPTVQTLLVRLAPTENRAAVMSLQGFVLRLGQTLGPLIMTVVLLFWGVLEIYWFGSILAII
ncbi:MAG: MFS transporter, partial [Candidatus Hermodarchaeota archaeon]|nr:MFS transporter [Candidatus Hermodarchaeota archaeon]